MKDVPIPLRSAMVKGLQAFSDAAGEVPDQAWAAGWSPMSHARENVRRVVEKSAQVVILAGLVGAITGFGVAGFERIVVNGLLDHIDDFLSGWWGSRRPSGCCSPSGRSP